MIYFGDKNDQELKKKRTCGSHTNKQKKKNNKKRRKRSRRGRKRFNFNFYFFLSHLSLRYTEIGPSEFVGARSKVLYSMRATRRNQKHGISPSF